MAQYSPKDDSKGGYMDIRANQDFVELKQRIVEWAILQDDIRLVILVGSRARTENPGSEYSDLDILLFTDAYEAYLLDHKWTENFGQVFLAIEGRTVADNPEIKVVYDHFQGIDFVFAPANMIQFIAQMTELPDIFLRGHSVWLDKEGVVEDHLNQGNRI
jgi:aminoglycoside 6-adenylyltransferase